MAETNFGKLLNDQKTVWARDVMRTARQHSFIMNLAGSDINSCIQRITELTKSERGTRAVITLVPDLEGDGAVGDSEIEGYEEEMKAYDLDINVDQLRNANKSAGRMAEQATVVKFRETSRDLLGYWLADRIDQLGALTLSGVDYRLRTNGALRPGFTHNGTDFSRNTTTTPVGYSLYDLEFAADVTAPSAKRGYRWNGTSKALVAMDTETMAATDTPSYEMLVQAKAIAKDRRLKPVKVKGSELYHVLIHPRAMARLKMDKDFIENIRHAGPRGNNNPLFTGAVITHDGLVFHEWTHAFNTLGATKGTSANAGTPGYKWGANADIDGSRILFLGAQALAVADLGTPEWDEDYFDYKAKPGIAISKIIGMRKPVFYSPMDGTTEDFGVLAIDVAI